MSRIRWLLVCAACIASACSLSPVEVVDAGWADGPAGCLDCNGQGGTGGGSIVLDGGVPRPRCEPWDGQELREATADAPVLAHGVGVFDVSEREAIVWTRSDSSTRLRVRYSAGEHCTVLVSRPVETTAARDFHAHMPLTDLEPDTEYRYVVELERGGASAEGAFRTAPARDRALRLAWSADVSAAPVYARNWDAIAQAAPAAYLSLGDFPYADAPPAAVELEDYRAKLAEVRDGPQLHALQRRVPIYATWDDHEVVNDWDGADLEEQPERVAAGIEAWHEWFPVRAAVEGEIYRRQAWGPGVELFILDTRSHRSANAAPDDGDKTMLGPAQLDWLLDGLATSTATFKLVATSVALAYGTTGNDAWNGFVSERDQILSLVLDARIAGVVFLSGDQHWFAAQHHQNGLKEYQAGPLAQDLRPPGAAPAWVTQIAEHNLGTLDYAPGPPASLTVRALAIDGTMLFEERIEAGLGTLDVEVDAATRWRTRGAHRFDGQGAVTLDYATPGSYTIEWLAADGSVDFDETGVLTAGAVLRFARP